MVLFQKTPLNIAHRGARSLAPENTLASARKALEIGADLWELDIAMTSDGEMILLHDDSLERTSNAASIFPQRHPWHVSDFSLEEIRHLDFGSWFLETDPFGQIAQGQVSSAEQNHYIGEPAPTLREALEFTRRSAWFVNIEIKDLRKTPGDQVIVEKIIALINEMEMTDQVIISSFNHKYLERSKKADRQIPTAALVFAPPLTPIRLLRRLDAQAYNPALEFVTQGTIHRLRKAGYWVNVYTVNDEKNMRRLIADGVSGIFTDFPQVLKTILKG